MSLINVGKGLLIGSVLLLQGCMSSIDSSPTFAYNATVHRTEGGIAHIIADDFGSMGFGTGYANAQDNFCITAKNILAVRGELSANFGPDNGNLEDDLFQSYMIKSGAFDGPISPELEFVFSGYAAGFNHYLRTVGVDNLPDPDCRGASWIVPMNAQDAKRSELMPAFLPRFASFFVAAVPPPQQINNSSKVMLERAKFNGVGANLGVALLANIESRISAKGKGSNGVAIGKDHTNHGGGLLYTNPHVDWDFNFFFFPRHQIIPGVTNLLGANTFDRALVGFGTNGKVAWTNTVSTSRTQSLYELSLVPGKPTTYLFDGKEIEMEAITVNVEVLNSKQELTTQTRTLYRTRHGLVLGGELFPWTTNTAFALRVADEGNRGQNGQSIALARATSVHDIKAAIARYQATANTNVIAADSQGETLYADLGPVANLTNEQLIDCATNTPVYIRFLAPAFKGDTSECVWGTDVDSSAPGLLGASKQASLIRQDYLTNSNSSFWLANPNAPITGIPKVQGDIGTERSLRTRSGLTMIKQRINGSDGLAGNTFDINSMLDRMLSNQSYAGQILRDDLVTLCEKNPFVSLDGEEIELTKACSALKGWDLHMNLNSTGAHVFREFIRAAHDGKLNVRGLPKQFNYSKPFDINDPVNTPAGLDTTNNPEVLISLATALKRLNSANITLNAKLGDIQYVSKNARMIPMHGGDESEGVFNKMAMDFADEKGYPAITGSSASWIMAVEFAESGPIAKGVLSYSLSSNKASERYAQMTELFAQKKLVDLPYTIEEVKAAAITTLELREGSDSCTNDNWRLFRQPLFNDEQSCIVHFNSIKAKQLKDWH